jgi:hypothetical protein
MRRTGIFTLCAVLAPQVAASYGVRLSAIPEAYWGTWVSTAEICQDADKSGIVLSAKAYVTSAVSCTVDYVAETASSKGPIYSARLQCSNKAGQSPKKVANLIIRPGEPTRFPWARRSTASSLINAVPRAARGAGRNAPASNRRGRHSYLASARADALDVPLIDVRPQSGRTSALTCPHRVQTIFGPSARITVSSGKWLAFMVAA